MTMIQRYQRLLAAVVGGAGLLLLAGCTDGGEVGTGRLNLGITDAPVDGASSVVVQFDAVEIKPKEGKAITIDLVKPTEEGPLTSPKVDLLSLQEGAREMLLDGVELPAGAYNYIRLMVTATQGVPDSYLTFTATGDATYPLYIPSGDETGLKLVGGFVIPRNGTLDFTIDFDLRKSIYKPAAEGQDYRLKPALRILQTDTTGAIGGKVDPAAYPVTTETCAVYVYEGTGVRPDDEGSAAPPVASTLVKLDQEKGEYRYRIAYLAEGSYTAALTCEAANDNPESDDDIAFVASASATVMAKQTDNVDF